MNTKHDLLLYMRPTCPFCQLVEMTIADLGISINRVDLDQTPEQKKELIKIGGKGQVPCLLIDGSAMYESQAIINWLKENT